MKRKMLVPLLVLFAVIFTASIANAQTYAECNDTAASDYAKCLTSPAEDTSAKQCDIELATQFGLCEEIPVSELSDPDRADTSYIPGGNTCSLRCRQENNRNFVRCMRPLYTIMQLCQVAKFNAGQCAGDSPNSWQCIDQCGLENNYRTIEDICNNSATQVEFICLAGPGCVWTF